jgi:hypothetical protein
LENSLCSTVHLEVFAIDKTFACNPEPKVRAQFLILVEAWANEQWPKDTEEEE